MIYHFVISIDRVYFGVVISMCNEWENLWEKVKERDHFED